MVWLRAFALPLPIAATYGSENTWGNGKIELYVCTCQPIVSDPKKNKEESVTLSCTVMVQLGYITRCQSLCYLHSLRLLLV